MTFAERGIPFPLYEAPIEDNDNSDFVGMGSCSTCGTEDTPCFSLGMGHLVVSCPSCETVNGLSVHDAASVPCRSCGMILSVPASVANPKERQVCYVCLRAGRAALTKDTEFGMITFEQAVLGVTHGGPGLQQSQFESVVLDSSHNEGWIGARIPSEVMFELLRTPTYGTWQGERWLFCCQFPMTFVGEWKQKHFNQRASQGDGRTLFYQIVADTPSAWESLGHGLSVYVFECKSCGTLRTHHDCD